MNEAAARIRQKLRKAPPEALVGEPLIGDDEEAWTAVKDISTESDGTLTFSARYEVDHQQVVPVLGPLISLVDADDIDDDVVGVLFTCNHSCAQQINSQGEEIADFLHAKSSFKDIKCYILDVTTHPEVGTSLALNNQGPEIFAIVDGFPQLMSCKSDGPAVERALQEKLDCRLFEICSEKQASIFLHRFQSSIIGVYNSHADHSYRLIVELALYLREVDSGVTFLVTRDRAAARKLLPCSFDRKEYIGMSHQGSSYPFTGAQKLSVLVKFMQETIGYRFKMPGSSTGNPSGAGA